MMRASEPSLAARRLSLAALLLAGGACAHRGPPPPSFAETPEFHAMSGRVYGILERDLDGDELADVVFAERKEYGYVLVVMHRVRRGEATALERVCESPLVVGEDLDAMRWLFAEGGKVFALALEESPEELVQGVAVVDAANGCGPLFSDEVRLSRGDAPDVVAPEGVRGGATLSDDAGELVIVDEPRYLRLHGVRGDVQVLTGVHERRVRLVAPSSPDDEAAAAKPLAPAPVAERNLSLLSASPVSVAWQSGAATAPVALPEVTDGDEQSLLEAKAGESGPLLLKSETPMWLLELHHGCLDGADEAPLELTLGDAVFVLGERPRDGSFVRAAGERVERAGERRDLILLSEPTRELSLVLGPASARRCLRDVKVFGYSP